MSVENRIGVRNGVIDIDSEVLVGVALIESLGVTVGGAGIDVGVTNLVGVTKGVRVIVAVAVGKGVPGVIVGVEVVVGERV